MSDERFHIKSDSPAVDDLMFWSIAGHEALSRASYYELTVLSRKSNLNASDILGRAFDVVIDFTDADNGEHERHCQGHAVRFTRVNQRGRYVEYRITLRSWFWLLTKRKNSRIFQDKTVVEVMNAVFDDSPIQRFKKLNTDHVIGKHEPRRYCVQHQESDYNFLSRLLEEEGIYHWFDCHDAPGTMYLSDASDVAHNKLPANDVLEFVRGGSGEMRFNEVTRWVSARRFDTGNTASRDSNFKTIKKKLAADRVAADDHELAEFEAFEFPGGYFNDTDAETVSQVRGEELQTRRDRHWALTGWTDVCAGMTFKLDGPEADVPRGDYLIAGCTFFISHPGYEGIQMPDASRSLGSVLRQVLADDAVNAQTLDVLEGLIEESPALQAATRGTRAFLLTVIPLDLLFRPPHLTPRVTMPGPQTAIVVGPAGEEIHADDFGRVKVHFHWDRYDASNEKSTAWVRVSQPWAGKGWGGYFIPRIGQEVIVEFLNGDPDRPIITGRVYNDDQPIPYKSPTQSGFKTRSTPGGGPANYNEIQFEDKKGAENINIHAERNMSRSVEVDDSTTVDRDQSVTVKRDQTEHVDRDRKSTVTRNETTMVAVDQKNTVKGNQNNQVVGNRESFVDTNDKLTVGGTHTTDVTGARSDTSRAGETRTVVGNQTVTVTGNITYKAANMSFEAAHIDWLVTGASSKNITVPTGPLNLMANKIKLMSNTGIEMMAVGSIDATSVGSNTTVLGPNASGYIGNNSEANLGLARSTFIGLSMENALAIAISNFAGVSIENTLGIKLVNCAAPEIESVAMDMKVAPLHTFTPGVGAGAAEGAVAAGMLGAVVGASTAFKDIKTTLKQYADAAKQLDDAAKEARDEKLWGLAARLTSLAKVTRNRRIEGMVGAVPVVGTALVVAVEAIGERAGLKTEGEQIADHAKTRNADGTAAPPPPPSEKDN